MMKENRCIMAIDLGLSYCKAVWFDAAGNIVHLESRPAPVSIPAAGRSEIDMEELWHTVSSMLKTAGSIPVAAAGVSGHGNGIYCIDSNGSPVGNAVTSMDLRAESEIELLPDEAAALLAKRSTQRLWAGQPGMILRWLKAHDPEKYRKISKLMFCKDYLSFMLTGVYVTDWSDLSASGLLNNLTGQYDPAMIEAFGLQELRMRMPPVIRGFDIRGSVSEQAAAATGLPSGIPVIGGMFDVDACIYGAGIAGPGSLCSISGTWNINAAIIEGARNCPQVRQCVRRTDGQSSMLIDSSATSAVNIEWLLKKMLPDAGYECFYNVVGSYPWRSDSPYWLPLINGTLGAGTAGGALTGLGMAHGRDDMMAAVAEGICFAHRLHIENLAAAGAKFERIRLTGGAAQPSFCRLFADVCGIPVETVDVPQAGAAGIHAAIRVALGMAADMASALIEQVNVKESFDVVQRRHRLFEIRYQRFKELIKCRL